MTKMRVVEARTPPVELEEGDVWQWLGSRDRIVPSLVDEVRRAMDARNSVCSPRAIYSELEVEEVERTAVRFTDGLSLEGKFFAHCFQGATEAAFLVVTIGGDLEERVSQLFSEGDSIAAMVLDAVGTATVIKAFDNVAGHICQQATESGRKTGRFLSPGQTYWDVSGQRSVFDAVPAQRIGVELTDTCFMVPQKSLSGAIPLGADLLINGDPSESQCRYCAAKRCPMRTEPQ
jgi:hypothetical protein